MALPQGFDVNNPACPHCGSRVYDNRETKQSPKSPDFRCSNQQCDSGNGRPWAAWLAPAGKGAVKTPQAQGARPVPAAAPAPALPPRQQVDLEKFYAVTNELAATTMLALVEICAHNKIVPSPDALLAETMTTVRQAWITAENGLLRLVALPPPPKSHKDKYLKALSEAASMMDVAKVAAEYGGDTTLDGTEKDDLAAQANARVAWLAADAASRDNIPGNE